MAGKYSGPEVRYGEPGDIPVGGGSMYRAFADSCIDCPPGVCTESIKRLVCVLIFRHVRSRLLEPVRCCCLHGLCSLEPRDSENTCVCKHGYFRQSAIQCTQCPYARTTLSENSLQLRDCVCNAGYTKSSDSCIHLMHDSRVLMTTAVPCRPYWIRWLA